MLSQLVGVPEQLFALSVQQLEQSSGNPGIDVRLSSEIIEKIHLHIRALGLDPNDTTGAELYYALLDLAELHDSFLAKRIGVTNKGDVADVLPRVVGFVEKIDVPKTTWAIKHSEVKKLIKSCPPKNVMKQLGYRSIDSMLKREKADELMVGCQILESSEWHSKLLKKYSKLVPSDFETRQVKFLLLDGRKWGTKVSSFVKKKHQNITHIKELGVVAVLPLPITYLNGASLAFLLRLLYYLNEVRTYGTYFKIKQVKANFGQIIVNALENDDSHHAVMGGQQIHWRVVHRYYGSSGAIYSENLFEPHLNSDDLFWRKAEEVLYKIEPALQFWHDMDYVGLYIDGQPISFNLMDVSANLVNSTPYGSHLSQNLNNAVWNELFIRYLSSGSLRAEVNRQFDVDVDPDDQSNGIEF